MMIANEKIGRSAKTAARRGPKPVKIAQNALIILLQYSCKYSILDDPKGIQ